MEEKANLILNPNAATKGKRKKKDMKQTAPEVDDSQTEAMYGNTTTRQLVWLYWISITYYWMILKHVKSDTNYNKIILPNLYKDMHSKKPDMFK